MPPGKSARPPPKPCSISRHELLCAPDLAAGASAKVRTEVGTPREATARKPHPKQSQPSGSHGAQAPPQAVTTGVSQSSPHRFPLCPRIPWPSPPPPCSLANAENLRPSPTLNSQMSQKPAVKGGGSNMLRLAASCSQTEPPGSISPQPSPSSFPSIFVCPLFAQAEKFEPREVDTRPKWFKRFFSTKQ